MYGSQHCVKNIHYLGLGTELVPAKYDKRFSLPLFPSPTLEGGIL